MTLTESEQFFYENAGYSYDPKTETSEDGRIRCARELARAEEQLKNGPYFVTHAPDDVPWDGDMPYDGPLWIVSLWCVEGATGSTLVGSVGSVACESDDPYMRVIAAELASEHIPE